MSDLSKEKADALLHEFLTRPEGMQPLACLVRYMKGAEKRGLAIQTPEGLVQVTIPDDGRIGIGHGKG